MDHGEPPLWAMDLGFSSVCQLFSRGPGTVGEGTVNHSYCSLGTVLSRRMICSDLHLKR